MRLVMTCCEAEATHLECTQIPSAPEGTTTPNLKITKRTQFSPVLGLAGPGSASPWIPRAGAV